MVFTGSCMTGFNLPTNYYSDPESPIRKSRSRLSSPGSSGSHVREIFDKFIRSQPPHEPALMASRRCINDFPTLSSANVKTGPEMNIGDGSFELKPALINMVQQSPFYVKASEGANAHLQHFLEICSTFTIRGVTQDVVRLHLFPFSLIGKAKQRFNSNKEAVPTWEKCSNAFLATFFPLGKTNALRNNISGFQQLMDETIAGMSAGLYLCMPPLRHGGVVHHPKLQSWADSFSPGSI
jgi:hypothetical protein